MIIFKPGEHTGVIMIRVALEPHARLHLCRLADLCVCLSVCMNSFIEHLLCDSHTSSIFECLPYVRCISLGTGGAKVNKTQSLTSRSWWPG